MTEGRRIAAAGTRGSSLELRSKALRIAAAEILLIACVRDELLRIAWFLDYHRKLGVDRFVIVDNGSTDGTLEYLSSQSDVSLFATDESYAASKCGINWTNELLDRYARGHWVLVLDADELFVYPRCEAFSLRDLVGYLDGVKAQCMQAPLLDMYSGTPIKDTGYRRGEPFLATCPFFDDDGYDYSGRDPGGAKVMIRGGPRQRLFWDGYGRQHPSPFLPKLPLVKWQQGLAFDLSTHTLRGARKAEATGVLLHFKFLQDFLMRVQVEADRKEHFAAARQYAAYAEIMAAIPELTAYHEGSVRYENSLQLVALGLMSMPRGYLA
ncbi:MAG: glycosyltransferase family 2 protein [Hyphomicrobiales bacterium]|nr:glycosyltransferase family 2 protein [Hyphomicrobiales bacterium]